MKKYTYNPIIITMLLAIMVSCSEYLEQLPSDGLVADEYWNNKEELHQVMIGAYAALADMDFHLFLNGELRADMVQQGPNLRDYSNGYYSIFNLINVMEASILSTNNFARWDKFYTVINLCNLVIMYAPKIQERDATFTDFYREAYIAEATALRSLMYFYLVRIYKDVPYVVDATESDNDNIFPAKSTDEEILDQIIEELVDRGTADNTPDFYGDEISTIGRMNRNAVYALIADIALWKFDYELALRYIDKIEAANYVLVSNAEWYNLFSEGNTFESIFEIQYTGITPQTNSLFSLTRNSTLDYLYTSKYAEELFIEDEFENKSLERTRTEGTLMEDGERDGFYDIFKYLGDAPNSNAEYTPTAYRSGFFAGANYVIYRYADILLMKAEALTQKANPDYEAALDIINLIRIRANVPNININDFGNSPISAEEVILEERALELAYEGKRWFDLLRYARRNDFAQKDNFIKKVTNNAPASMRLIIASRLRDPQSWYLPIYETEIENNKNLKQNPYYE